MSPRARRTLKAVDYGALKRSLQLIRNKEKLTDLLKDGDTERTLATNLSPTSLSRENLTGEHPAKVSKPQVVSYLTRRLNKVKMNAMSF